MATHEALYKKKKVSDLIRYIKNTTENNRDGSNRIISPNYSILLGSGASITSGIRSGGQLISAWKEEIYNANNDGSFTTVEDFFNKDNAPGWYDENDAYSCLFEELFDLQRQRRIFVEKEVSGKTPSIGYAYLVKLIENGYFNTVFTTNFDDLLNEAFYRFSGIRPIVCAHDSSISGITVTSSRPKIIKLHGDYLFDNIKATPAETESLEINMKLKFQEFAKDFGLIVVGYSGNDRSIMDIITELLRSREHFKNGIYWCIRKGENEKDMSSDLRKLLSKDRVFLVEIDGFDEFFAELNHFLNKGCLPIDDSLLSIKHQEQIISDLTNNTFLNSTQCIYLKDDCERLRSSFQNNLFVELLKNIKKQKSGFTEKKERMRATRKSCVEKMSMEEAKEVEDLSNDVFLQGKGDEVLSRLKNMNVLSLKDNQFKVEMLELYADLNENMVDSEIKEVFDELIRLCPTREKYCEIAANRSVDFKQKIYYWEKAVSEFCNDPYVYNEYTEALLDYFETKILFDVDELKKIRSLIDKSIELDKSITNSAYYYKLRWIVLSCRNNSEKRDVEINDLCKTVSSISLTHPTTIKILRKASYKNFSDKDIDEAIGFYMKADRATAVEKLIIEKTKFYVKEGNIDKALACLNEFEKDFIGSDSYKTYKCDLLTQCEYFEDAIRILDSIPYTKGNIRRRMRILGLLSKDKEVEELYNKLKNKSSFTEDYWIITHNHDALIQYYKEKINAGGELNLIEENNYVFSLLKKERFNDVSKLLKSHYDNPRVTDGATIVNYLFSQQKIEMGKDIVNKVRKRIIDNKYIKFSDSEILGAYCIMNDVPNVIKYLKAVLRTDPVDKYGIKSWPVMAPYLSNPKIAELLKPEPKILTK